MRGALVAPVVSLLLALGLAGCAATDTVQPVSVTASSPSSASGSGSGTTSTEASTSTSTSTSTTSTTEKTTTTRRPTTTKAPTSTTSKRSTTTAPTGSENGYSPQIKQAFLDQCVKSSGAGSTSIDKEALCQCVIDEIVATIPFAEFLEISQQVLNGTNILSTKLGAIITKCATTTAQTA
jgi:hypothetical protein